MPASGRRGLRLRRRGRGAELGRGAVHVDDHVISSDLCQIVDANCSFLSDVRTYAHALQEGPIESFVPERALWSLQRGRTRWRQRQEKEQRRASTPRKKWFQMQDGPRRKSAQCTLSSSGRCDGPQFLHTRVHAFALTPVDCNVGSDARQPRQGPQWGGVVAARVVPQGPVLQMRCRYGRGWDLCL